MRTVALAFVFVGSCMAPALADQTTVFPPQDCGLGVPSLISTTQTAVGEFTSTICRTPLDVLTDAWPCADGQAAVKSNGVLTCQFLGTGNNFRIGTPVSISVATAVGSTDYVAPADGLLFIGLGAGPSNRSPELGVSVDGSLLTFVLAQDSTVEGVSSVSWTNFSYPLRKGQKATLAISSPANAVVAQFVPLD
jgi:hypothetical protein